MSYNGKHRRDPIQCIRRRTLIRGALQVKTVGPVIAAIQTQTQVATACSTQFTFQVDN